MPSLHIGDKIRNFPAVTTHGKIQFYDWQGDSWVVLFSHPADFTPVCTSELGRIAIQEPLFRRRKVKLLAHSCDALKTHNDWIIDIKAYCDDTKMEFPYPIITDETCELANELDMLSKNGKETVRALYIIDSKHEIRLMMHYPASTGRNVEEILRVIDSLQLVDKLPQIVTPVNWKPGDKVMVDPKVSDDEIKKVFPSGVNEMSMPSGFSYIRTTNCDGLIR